MCIFVHVGSSGTTFDHGQFEKENTRVDRYGTRTMQHIHVRSDNECWIILYLHVVQKSVEFSGVGSLTH